MPTLQSPPKSTPEETLKHVTQCCKALDGKKAGKLVVLDMRKAFDVTDYFVIATGTSAPHLRALFSEMDAVLSNLGYQIPSKMKDYHTGWVVVDAIDFVLHLFTDEQREFYSIERLWKDCPQVKIDI